MFLVWLTGGFDIKMVRGILAADGRRRLLSCLCSFLEVLKCRFLVDNIIEVTHTYAANWKVQPATVDRLNNIRQDERERREWYVRTVPPLTHAHLSIAEIVLLTRRADSVNYWIYEPNKGAPVFFAVAFAVSGLWQLWQG